MKKNNIVLLTFILFTNLIFAQSNFDRGFEVGYKKGFCQDQGISCIEPVTPVSPVPGVNESYNSYTDGYNRGFTMAIKKRNSKKSNSSSVNPIPKYERPIRKYNPIKSQINYKQISSTLNSMQAKIDNNRNVLNNAVDILINKRDILNYKIKKLNYPVTLKNQLNAIQNSLLDCANDVDYGSNRQTSITISCFRRIETTLNILEYEIDNYSISDNNNNNNNRSNKNFVVNFTKKKNFDYCRITRVVNKENETIIEFEYTSPFQKDGWINISGDTHIYDATNGEKLKLIGVWNTEISPKRKDVPYNEKITFQLTFERLKNNSQNINIIECERDSCFNFYGVSIN